MSDYEHQHAQSATGATARANGSQPKIQIECPACKTVFSVPMPKNEILNGLFSSAIVGPHPRLSKCIACGQQFLLAISGAQVEWGAMPVGPEIAQQVEGTSLITPSLVVPG